MDNNIEIIASPNFVVIINHEMGGVAAGFNVNVNNTGFTVLSSTGNSSGTSMTDGEIKTAYENNADTNAFDDAAVSKLAGIEAAAKDDLTGGEIKTLYEGEANTNAFDDAAVSKLTAIEASATIDQTDAEIRTAVANATDSNVFQDADASKLDGIESGAKDDQTNSEIKTAYESNANTNVHTDAQVSKLAGIDTGAKDDQTDAEIRTAVEAATDSNVFTDADHSKLNAVEASATADQTDSEIEAAYNTQVAAVSAGEMTGGTEAAIRRFSPDNIENMIQIHAPGGGGSQGWTINNQTGTSYTLVVADIQKLVRLTNAAAIALTVPTNAAQAIAIGSQIRIAEYGVGTVTIDGAGVTLNTADDLILGTQHEGALLIKVATNEWDIIKDLGGSGSMTDSEVKTAYENNANTNEFDDAEQTKLAGIETSATADQTDAEIRTAIEAATDSNAFTDADHSKLNAIEASATADQSNAEIEAAYAAVNDQVSAGEITAGTEPTLRTYAPDDIVAFIDQHAPGGGGAGLLLQYTKVQIDTDKGIVGSAAVIWDSIRQSEGTPMWSAGNPTRLTADGAGMYLWGFHGDTTATTTAAFPGVVLNTDALSDITVHQSLSSHGDAASSGSRAWSVVGSLVMADGDYLQCRLSGSTMTLEAHTSSSFWLMKLAVASDVDFYDLGMDFIGKPTDAQVIARWIVLREVTMPADFSGAGGDIITNPTSTMAIDIKDDGTTIGTVSIATNGVFTFTTVSGTEKVVAAGSIVTAIGPGTADTTGEDIVFTLPGVL